ncbi:hypothetical protein CBR_g40975 [Chara braunii]|uniref:Uncharacterized protein n=1 Tax=Chara braunii TaxID=69332 RepID=A0A388LV10_CHABU|nr:hypothetical protein CBR_g40975 [Chara braunii]|eukprot:GBG86073.1 hypothetical protein CBR_g40975 [Chara braunii]
MKEHMDNEIKKKEEKAKRKREKLEQKRREEEARLAEVQAREEAERRKKRKEDKLRLEAEAREQMKKEMRTEASKHMGGLREELMYLCERGDHQEEEARRGAKGKKKIEAPASDDEAYNSYEMDCCTATELLLLEQAYISQWSPILNTAGKIGKQHARNNGRKGRKERSRQQDGGSRREPASFTPVRAKIGDGGIYSMEIYHLLADMEEAGTQMFTLHTEGGNVWCRGWKSVRSSFGDSIVRREGVCCKLRECKSWIEQGGTLEFRQLRRWKPRIGPHKKFLLSILRNPYRRGLLKRCSLEVLIRLNRVAADFQKASTTSFLRRLISRTVKDVYSCSLNAKMIVRIKFDDRIKMVEFRKLLNDRIEELQIPVCMKNVARNKVRIVWVKNPSIAVLLHNQRSFAKAEVLTCTCTGLPYPWVGDHVQFILQELEDVDPLIFNANNVPRHNHPNRGALLRQELTDGIRSWANFRGQTPRIGEGEVARCMMATIDRNSRFIDVNIVEEVKTHLNGLVLTPLDRNAGETLVLCPKVYIDAMMELFVSSPGYVVMSNEEAEVKLCMREEAKREGLLPCQMGEEGEIR